MNAGPVLLDSDTLSDLSRGHRVVTARAAEYLERHGRLTVSAVSIFERLRGYRGAIRLGNPLHEHMRQFELFAATCIVFPVDTRVADEAATIWAQLGRRGRRLVGDILIAATARVHGMPLVTRNRRDFEPMARVEGAEIALLDWRR